MHVLEGAFLWTAVTGYSLSLAGLIVTFLFHRERLRAIATGLAVTAWLSHTATILVRWFASGHAPVQGAYENSIAGGWFLPLILAVAWRWYPAVARGLPIVLVATLLILGNGIMTPAALAPLEPPYRSNWLAVHVVFAWLAFGAFVVAAGMAGWYLWLTRGKGSHERAAALDEVSARLVAVGFLADSVMIASGAIWAHGLWGQYWGWDPIETWSLVTWLVYALYLHLRFTLSWMGRRAAWLGVLAALSVLVAFFGIGIITGAHTELLRPTGG